MYTFPFNTCETPKKGVVQPYSAMLNAINCIMIAYFLVQTKNPSTFLLLFSIFCFEFVHVFSHTIHIPGSIQINITHFLTYVMNIAFFYVFYCYTKIIPGYLFLFYIIALICIDIYSYLHLTILYYLLSQSILFISVLLYYLPLLPKYVQSSIYKIIGLISIIILLFLNETYNCKKMLDFYSFPYHVLIEMVGILLFYTICSTFYTF
jgi:hypothetical protein